MRIKISKRQRSIIYFCIISTLIIFSTLFLLRFFNPNVGLVDKNTSKIYSNKNSPPKGSDKIFYNVVHIVDGDTIDIIINGSKVRLRLLGINSPESVASNRPDECFGTEASNNIKKLLENRKVYIEYDPLKKDKADVYGRELVYVYRDDGLFINKEMIKTGSAHEYTYQGEKYTYQNDFKKYEGLAKSQKIGLWSSSTCGGKK